MKRIRVKSTVLRLTVAVALISTLVGIVIAASLYRNGLLNIMVFRIEHNQGGSWSTAPQLINGQKYRFRFDVANLASYRQRNRQFDKIRFKISGSYLRFYNNASFTGSWRAVYDGTPSPNKVITRGQTKRFYVYFKWGGTTKPTVPMSPLPKVSMTGRDFIMMNMGSEAYLQPNR